MLGGIIIIVGLIISGELASLFNKAIKHKLSKEIYRKYRFGILAAVLLLYCMGMLVSFVIGGMINGATLSAVLPGILKYAAALFLGGVAFAGLCLLVKRLVSAKKEKDE